MLPGELSAGGGDVMPSFNAFRHVDLVVFEGGSEIVDTRAGGALESVASVDPVEGDEVDDAGGAFNQFGEGFSLFGGVVDF